VITLDFSKAPGTAGSPFRLINQVLRNTDRHIWIIQQFSGNWGYLICDLNRSPVASDWRWDWSAADALAALNAKLEELT
jgi:hypothetical protein